MRPIKLCIAAALSLAAFAAAAKSNWVIDPARTQIKFAVDAAGWPRTAGVFHKFDGRISVDFERPERSHVDFTVQTNSVDLGSGSFDSFVRGAAMLDADKFPTMSFTSNKVEKTSDKTVHVEGDLTMRGVTKPLAVDVDVRRVDGRLEFSAHAHLDRLEWDFNSGYPIISRDVEIDIVSAAKAT